MKKPTEAIEKMREFYGSGRLWDDSVKTVLSYIDSIHEWPADLTRERLEKLANEDFSSWSDRSDALRRLAAIAPKREKRKVEIWEEQHTKELHIFNDPIVLAGRYWRKVGEVEIDA